MCPQGPSGLFFSPYYPILPLETVCSCIGQKQVQDGSDWPKLERNYSFLNFSDVTARNNALKDLVGLPGWTVLDYYRCATQSSMCDSSSMFRSVSSVHHVLSCTLLHYTLPISFTLVLSISYTPTTDTFTPISRKWSTTPCRRTN
jgi:hypothetical protein